VILPHQPLDQRRTVHRPGPDRGTTNLRQNKIRRWPADPAGSVRPLRTQLSSIFASAPATIATLARSYPATSNNRHNAAMPFPISTSPTTAATAAAAWIL